MAIISALFSLTLLYSCAFSVGYKRFSCNSRLKMTNSFPSTPNDKNRQYLRFINNAALSFFGIVASSPSKAIADDRYAAALLNAPSDDFWYPPYLIGKWNCTLTFDGAKFTEKIPIDTLAIDDNIPGFSKYSVAFVPNMGKDVENLILRFVQIDSHPREDHPFNIRNIFKSFLSDSQIDSAPYYFQKAMTWFSSFSNKWNLKYHDSEGSGEIDLFTRKRDIKVFGGAVDTIEFFHQTHRRKSNENPEKIETTIGDYAINWKLFNPTAKKDEFVTQDDLRKTDTIIGNLDILSFLQPDNNLYMKTGPKPAAVFSYNVTMTRIGTLEESVKDTVYPFVWRGDGPVELNDYFGY